MSGVILTGIAEVIDSPHAGGKARALARAQRAGLPVSPWFVVPSTAFFESLTTAQRTVFETASEPEEIRRAVECVMAGPSLVAALGAAVSRICPAGELVAVRSSAPDEDGVEHSFAGQLESFLNVAPAAIAGRIADVWRSGFSARVLAYRRERGIAAAERAASERAWLPSPPGVLVQRMVAARTAGVAFGADPTTGRRSVAVVSAIPGFGTALVSGEADADTWKVDRAGAIVERHVAMKQRMDIADSEIPAGVRTVNVPLSRASVPSLSDAEVQRVAALVREAGRHFGRPQDIEWAMADDLVLLQSRPITSLRAVHDPDAALTIWDNSNIVESYSGVTTPLTFSFAREIYQHVYRQFCRMMGVSDRVIRDEEQTFANMLGLVRGRMYYNLLSWYRVLALLPGYQVNRRFMEQMMGVKEALPDALATEVTRGLSRGRLLDALHLTRTVGGLVLNHLTLDRRVDAFYLRLERALISPVVPLEALRIDELVAHYRELRGRLLLSWDAPLVNDFFAMIFYGGLRTLVIRWCGDPGGSLQNDLVGGAGGVVSAEPAVRMQRLARLAIEASLVETLTGGTPDEIGAALAEAPRFRAEFDAYLAKFGERTVNELKLESTTFHDEPLPLLRAIGSLARRSAREGPAEAREGPAEAGHYAGPAEARHYAGPAEAGHYVRAADRLRAESRERVRRALAGHPVRRLIFGWVLRHAQRRVRDRENLRLERTRLFGRVRRIFLEIGRRLAAADTIEDARDIFDLEVDEILAFADGSATTTDLRGLVALRRREFQRYREEPAPPSRFETYGSPYSSDVMSGRSSPGVVAPGPKGPGLHGEGPGLRGEAPGVEERRQGLGCCPGIVRGPVRLITDPLRADLERGSILVAEHTDPGWILVFPSATGILVERGSLLSHAAIVARELGIPTVVSIPGLTAWLKDGDWVEIDGSAGVVRRIDRQAGGRA